MKIDVEDLEARFRDEGDDALRGIATSWDFSEDARQAARKVLTERGLELPPLAAPPEPKRRRPLSMRARLLLLATPLVVMAVVRAWVGHRAHEEATAALVSAHRQEPLEPIEDPDPATAELLEAVGRGEATLEVGSDGDLVAVRRDGTRADVPSVSPDSAPVSEEAHDVDGPWEVACSREPSECLNAGLAHESGDGAPRDVTKALTYFDRACGAGLQRGCVEAARVRGEQDGPDREGALIGGNP